MWIACSLTLYGNGQSTPQTIVAHYEHGRVELFSVEFMLNEFLPRGRGGQLDHAADGALDPLPAAGNEGQTNPHLLRGCERHSQSVPPEQNVARAGVPVPGR